jgi:hypothetical protein
VTYLIAILVGLLAGTHTATWGMYKDAPHEGFRHYPRSIIVSTVAAPVIAWFTGIDLFRASGLVLLFGVTYCVERGLTEFYKTFVRFEDQSKYTIPMQFHVFGHVIPAGGKRWAIAAAHVAVVFLAGWGIHSVHQLSLPWPTWVTFALLGSIGGWLSAFGGAFKDAPIEGFETLKFFRSPALAASYSLVLSLWTHSYLLAALGGLGYTVATIETYKTFFFPNKPRGKFANKPILFPEHLQTRRRFVPIYAAIWLFVIVSAAIAASQLQLRRPSDPGSAQTLPVSAQAAP